MRILWEKKTTYYWQPWSRLMLFWQHQKYRYQKLERW